MPSLFKCAGLVVGNDAFDLPLILSANAQQWKLKRVEPTKDSILRVDCVFEGEQTSFEDDLYE